MLAPTVDTRTGEQLMEESFLNNQVSSPLLSFDNLYVIMNAALLSTYPGPLRSR